MYFSLFLYTHKYTVIEEEKEKEKRISLPKGFSCWPVLIHVNGVTNAVIDSGYFCKIIDFSSLLNEERP
jgi:hypothetical protein